MGASLKDKGMGRALRAMTVGRVAFQTSLFRRFP